MNSASDWRGGYGDMRTKIRTVMLSYRSFAVQKINFLVLTGFRQVIKHSLFMVTLALSYLSYVPHFTPNELFGSKDFRAHLKF